jgi:peptide/nickel transport system substrate-binding protein
MTRALSPLRLTATVLASLLLPISSGGEDVPKRGGTLEFAVTVEPGNYDCHGNTSFPFLHPVAPHYCPPQA